MISGESELMLGIGFTVKAQEYFKAASSLQTRLQELEKKIELLQQRFVPGKRPAPMHADKRPFKRPKLSFVDSDDDSSEESTLYESE